MDNQLKEQKINAFIESLKSDENSKSMSALELLEKIEDAGIISAVELEQLRGVEQSASNENATFKSAVLSNLVYTRYDDVIEYINEQKINGVTPTIEDIIDSGKLSKETSPLDVASLAYYAKTFTPVNVMPEGQFSFNNYKSLDEDNEIGANRKMSVSYKNGVYRADDNLAMAMTVMSEGRDGKPEINVSFRGTDVDSKNKMIEPDGTVVKRENGMNRYVSETYLDMTGHKKRAFGPLVEAITKVTQSTENRKFEEDGNSFADFKKRKEYKISVVATGHSLGGGMVEEWTKSNSNHNVPSFLQSVTAAKESAGFLKAHGAYDSLQERFGNDLNGEINGQLSLKSITFGAPSNSRNTLATLVENKRRDKLRTVVEFSTIGVAMTGLKDQIKLAGDNPELQDKLIDVKKYSKMMKGHIGDGLRELRSETKKDAIDEYDDKKFKDIYKEYHKQMDDKILKRDLQVYSTPYDPVAKHLLGMGFSRTPGNFNIVKPLAQKDSTFSIATQGLVDRYNKDGVENPDVDLSVAPEKKTILGSIKSLGKSVVSVIAKVTDFAVFKSFSKFMDKNFNIDYHSMKAYVGTTMLKASPIRNNDNLAEMSGFDKLTALVDLKAKKDIVAMEIITKEAGIENVVRQYSQNLDKGSKEAFTYSDFKSKGNAWENMPGSDELTRQMTSNFNAIKETFGGAVALSSKEIPNVSPDIASEVNKTTQQKLAQDGLPKRFESYKGRSQEVKNQEAIEFVHQKVKFAETLSDFVSTVKNTDLSKLSADEMNANPMLKPKEAHVMYMDSSTFSKPEKHSFGVPDGKEPIVVRPGIEAVSLRKSEYGGNVWENAEMKGNNFNVANKKNETFEVNVSKSFTDKIQHPTIKVNIDAMNAGRYLPADMKITTGMKNKLT